MEISRREFIRQVMLLGFSATTTGMLSSLLSCSSEKTPMPTPPLVWTPTHSPTPTLVPKPSPSPTASSVPTSTPSPKPSPEPTGTHVAVAHGQSPTAMVQAAVKALGGIERFVKTGDDVIIKPNICVAYHTYEYAATTNPEVIGALIRLCLGAGARQVRVMDAPFGGTPEEAYTRSGIAEVVRAVGGQMEVMSQMKYRTAIIPEGRDITSWPVYQDVLDADVLINVPIAKHHGDARLTLGMKNLMGVVLSREKFHYNLNQRIADLTSLIRPELTVIDAVRILMNHGPTGGDLNDVKQTNTIIASPDIVAADAYAATLFGLTGADIPATRTGADMRLGIMDLSRVKVEEIKV